MSTEPAATPSTHAPAAAAAPSEAPTRRAPVHAPHSGHGSPPQSSAPTGQLSTTGQLGTTGQLSTTGQLGTTGHPVTIASHPPRPEPIRLVAFEPTALRRAVVGVLVIVTLWMQALWVFSAVSRFLFLLLLSWLFAMAMEPAVAGLVRRGFRRGVATGLVGGSVLGVVVVLGALFGNLFFTQLSQLVSASPQVVTEVISWANHTFHLKLDAASIATSLKLTPSQVGTMASDLAGGVLGLVSSLLSALLDAFTFVVFAFYLAADGPRVRRTIGSWLSPAHQDVFVTVWDIAVAKTGGYVVSKVELAALSAIFHGVFFSWIQVPYWLPMALLVGMLAQFVPVLGTYIGVIVPVLFVVFTDPWRGLWILLFATAYQQVETYVFTPRISRRTMDVNSGIALASVFIGSALWGVVGALIGIPLAAATVALLDTYGHRHELVPALLVEPDRPLDEDEAPLDPVPEDSEDSEAGPGG
jgi:predicted PurR-regulated permease PerM